MSFDPSTNQTEAVLPTSGLVGQIVPAASRPWLHHYRLIGDLDFDFLCRFAPTASGASTVTVLPSSDTAVMLAAEIRCGCRFNRSSGAAVQA